jgi:AraC family transcriptional regulator, regulatory protein of adaptative response / methylphosphotriester-DNA alkyltransferase methyltransferase
VTEQTAARLSITHARTGPRRVLVVEGPVDLHGAPLLAHVLHRATRCSEPLAIDLCDARADTAAGVALVVNAVRRLHRHRADVTIVCPPGEIRTALVRAGLARRVALLDDRAALNDARPPGNPAPATATATATAPAAAPAAARVQRPATPERRGALLAEATLVIEERFAEPDLSLADVAREIATSERQLQRVFAELGGSAFRDEVAAVRMQHAAALLQGTGLPVADIAHRVGYRQAAQFAKAFRRHHGLAPSRFRRIPG